MKFALTAAALKPVVWGAPAAGVDAAFDRHMGFTFEQDGGRVIGMVRVDASMHNPTGRLHGGVIAGLADSAMGHLCVATIGACTNTDLQLRFLRGVQGDLLRAEASFLRRGRRISVLRCDVFDGDRLVAVAQSQFVPIP